MGNKFVFLFLLFGFTSFAQLTKEGLNIPYSQIPIVANALRENERLLTIIDSISAISVQMHNDLLTANIKTVEADKREREAQETLIKSAKTKRFGIGPQIGIQYTSESVKPYVGIGVHIDVFRF